MSRVPRVSRSARFFGDDPLFCFDVLRTDQIVNFRRDVDAVAVPRLCDVASEIIKRPSDRSDDAE